VIDRYAPLVAIDRATDGKKRRRSTLADINPNNNSAQHDVVVGEEDFSDSSDEFEFE
jgi:hypothetical protein